MTPDQIKQLAKQAGVQPYEHSQPHRESISFTPVQLAEFVRLVRDSAFAEARWAIESANAERHIDVADCVQIIQELK